MSEEKDLEQSEEETVVEIPSNVNEDYKEQYLRALADYQNLSRQAEKDKCEFFRYALADFLQDILPVYDNLKMSVANLKEEEQKSPWVEGVKYVLKQFKDVLEARGVEEIKTTGEKFDHTTMEAFEGEGELVEREVKAGYKLNGKVISPAKVIVKK
ncbi:nucleotide exchange factor GrpE [Candidatus Falkowbacteria bacterium CG10_big_fil_rev_8_21_14_0_10_39_9]|uniref:Protein GrpE n=1 Tax=Candidatus Falkowbacteria bacterium CG10_big_fil_rev_8_21_14_0_10_39_9 TaxID=1974566 RepID=A0A2M6WPJ4_9BACT|nr:MAG: nucleotide exchange factor GrpE [Candidatus Falkowbacteria bacterium CG10_big_fil_rev_8_21_14_0_10_39_9]